MYEGILTFVLTQYDNDNLSLETDYKTENCDRRCVMKTFQGEFNWSYKSLQNIILFSETVDLFDTLSPREHGAIYRHRKRDQQMCAAGIRRHYNMCLLDVSANSNASFSCEISHSERNIKHLVWYNTKKTLAFLQVRCIQTLWRTSSNNKYSPDSFAFTAVFQLKRSK